MSITPPKNNPYLFGKSYRIYSGRFEKKKDPSQPFTHFIHSLSVSPASSPLCSGSRWVSHLLSSDRLPGHHHQSPILLLAHIPQGRTYTDLSEECSVEPELSPHWCRHHPGPPRRTRCLDQQSEESSRRRAPKGRTHPVRVLEQDHLGFCDKDRSRWKEINKKSEHVGGS